LSVATGLAIVVLFPFVLLGFLLLAAQFEARMLDPRTPPEPRPTGRGLRPVSGATHPAAGAAKSHPATLGVGSPTHPAATAAEGLGDEPQRLIG